MRPEQERAPGGRETRWRRIREAAGRNLRPFRLVVALRRRMTRGGSREGSAGARDAP